MLVTWDTGVSVHESAIVVMANMANTGKTVQVVRWSSRKRRVVQAPAESATGEMIFPGPRFPQKSPQMGERQFFPTSPQKMPILFHSGNKRHFKLCSKSVSNYQNQLVEAEKLFKKSHIFAWFHCSQNRPPARTLSLTAWAAVCRSTPAEIFLGALRHSSILFCSSLIRAESFLDHFANTSHNTQFRWPCSKQSSCISRICRTMLCIRMVTLLFFLHFFFFCVCVCVFGVSWVSPFEIVFCTTFLHPHSRTRGPMLCLLLT